MKLARFTNAPRTADLPTTETIEIIGTDEHGGVVRHVRIPPITWEPQEARYGTASSYVLTIDDLRELVAEKCIRLHDVKEDQRRRRK